MSPDPALAHGDAAARAGARVRGLAAEYEPPDFAHVPGPDAALFLCAVDHRTGYRGRYLVGGRGPFEGSALMWAVALRAAERRSGLLTAAGLREIGPREVAELFRIGGETVCDPERRAELWRGLAAALERDHGGETEALVAAADGWLAALLGLLGRHDAFSDPLAKKALLFAKIAERRGWLTVADPEHWEVCADNVLMRLALRAGLVAPGPLADVRAATRVAFRRVAEEADVPPPLLDDLLWELGRSNPDLLGSEGGDMREPARDPESHWY